MIQPLLLRRTVTLENRQWKMGARIQSTVKLLHQRKITPSVDKQMGQNKVYNFEGCKHTHGLDYSKISLLLKA